MGSGGSGRESASPTSRSSGRMPTVGWPARTGTAHSLAVATYQGQRRNPVLLGRAMWPKARQLDGDEGARVLMDDESVVEVDCTDTGSAADVDTLDDLREAERLLEAR